jgi:hypothetical protein
VHFHRESAWSRSPYLFKVARAASGWPFREIDMPTSEEKFAEEVLACVDDLNAVLPRLAARYEDLVIVAALAEHVGGALRIFMHAGLCSPEQAHRVLKHVQDTAFSAQLEAVLQESEQVQ